MNKKTKIFVLCAVVAIVALFICSCEQASIYGSYDNQGYNVAVKFDANTGVFAASGGVTVFVDTYNVEGIEPNEDGIKEIYVVPPDSEQRFGKENQMLASKSGYFLSGWYQNREPVVNDKGEALDVNGVVITSESQAPAYTYSGRWDFSKPFSLDPNREYSATEPALTLYAGWIPEFEVQYYTKDENGNDVLLGTDRVTPIPTPQNSEPTKITLPTYNINNDRYNGTLDYKNFPKIAGKTFDKAYINGELITGEVIYHPGTYDLETSVAQNNVLRIDIEYKDGIWYKINSFKALSDNDSKDGIYELIADIDCGGKTWPLSNYDFEGAIYGNGHKITNVKATRSTDTGSHKFGLFRSITSKAIIDNVTFENVTVTISKGYRPTTNIASFGLFAGVIENGAQLNNVQIKSSELVISEDVSFSALGYELGLLCGEGYSTSFGIDISEISYRMVDSAYVLEEKVLVLDPSDNHSLTIEVKQSN